MPDLMLHEYKDLSDAEIGLMLDKELRRIFDPRYTEDLNGVSNKYGSTCYVQTYKKIHRGVRYLKLVSSLVWSNIVNHFRPGELSLKK